MPHLACTLAALLLMAGLAFTQTKIEAVQGQGTFAMEYDRATDFSGITWAGGEVFYAVSNKVRALFPLTLRVVPETGRIVEGRFGAPIPVKTKHGDFEGIAFVPALKRLYVSTETGSGIVGFDLHGDATFVVEVPKVFASTRRNKGLESLTYGADALWTANEEALEGDGTGSSGGAGTVVRLQKFDSRMRPVAQFAYRTEPSLFRVANAGTGVSDLLALPNGELLVMERVVGLGLSVKIFRVDFTASTDTSALARLDGADFTPVRKTLLYERHTAAANFEGITLGPLLADGWRSLILIEDSGGESRHLLIPLRIHFEPAKAEK